MAVKTTVVNGVQNYKGALYEFSLQSGAVKVAVNTDTDYREPDVLSDNSLQETAAGITLNSLQAEYNELVESVIKNGGFYIGRYESGSLGTASAVTKANSTGYNNVDWFHMYASQKNMNVGTSGAKTHMIWGSQWDQVMIWMKDVKNTTDSSKYFILDSTGMGVYNVSNPLAPGQYQVKGVYDLAGNVFDWTMEAYDTDVRACRGR